MIAALSDGACPVLEDLDAGCNDMQDKGAEALGSALSAGACPRLKKLGLFDNGIERLPVSLACLPSYVEVDLNENEIEWPEFEDGVDDMPWSEIRAALLLHAEPDSSS